MNSILFGPIASYFPSPLTVFLISHLIPNHEEYTCNFLMEQEAIHDNLLSKRQWRQTLSQWMILEHGCITQQCILEQEANACIFCDKFLGTGQVGVVFTVMIMNQKYFSFSECYETRICFHSDPKWYYLPGHSASRWPWSIPCND